jgi:hypothetical protein
MSTWRSFAVALLVVGLTAGTLSAQHKGKGTPSRQKNNSTGRGIEYQVRYMYEHDQADGMKVVIYKALGGNWVATDPSEKFQEGDRIKVEFTSNFPGNIYIINVMPDSRKRVLYPYPGKENATVVARTTYTYPDETGIYRFDNQPGIEVLQFILSRSPIAVYDEAIKQPKGDIVETASNAAAELSAKAQRPKESGITSNTSATTELEGYGTRDVRFAEGKAKKSKATIIVVAAPDQSVKSPPLEEKTVAKFEIRLNHVAR